MDIPWCWTSMANLSCISKDSLLKTFSQVGRFSAMTLASFTQINHKLPMMSATWLALSLFLQFPSLFHISVFFSFRSAKSSKIVELTSSSINATTLDPTQQIDIRRQAMLRSIDEINWSDDKCSALEIECVPFQSNSFAIHPIQHENIKKNSTVPENVHHQKGHETIFVPINATDPSNVFFKPFNKTEKIHSWNHLLDFDWPWNAEIYSNGDLVANGILLDKSWVLVEKTCLGNDQEPLHENHVVALFGNSKSSFVIQSPYEQLANVDCLQFINDSNALLLHLESPIDFNRHVLPSFLPILWDDFLHFIENLKLSFLNQFTFSKTSL